MVAAARLVQVSVNLLLAGAGLGHFEGFQDGAGVVFAAAEVIDLAGAGCLAELEHEAGHVQCVDIVADLFAFVAVDLVFAAFQVALHQVTEEAVQLDPGMIRAGQTAAAQATGRQAEVAAIFLHHHVGGSLGGAEHGVLGLVDGKGLGNAARKLRVGIVPTPLQFLEGNGVGPIPVDLVGGHVNEGRLRTVAPGGFEQVQGPHSVHIEIIEGDAGRQIVRGLGGGVDDDGGLKDLDQFQNGGAVANIKLVMGKAGQRPPQPLLIPAGIALRAEEDLALVIVHTVNGKAATMEEDGDFRAD